MSETSLPLWLVLGRTRVGKGEFIKATVRRFTGEELNITSDRMESHTKHSSRYSFNLKGKDVALMDTVGYDDSNGDDVSCEAFLKMLSETGKELFYPPLVILRDLSGSDKEWLKRIRSVFSSIVCAIRSSTKRFKSAMEYREASDLSDIKVFHLHEFQDEDEDDGRSYKLYLKDVEEIVSFYSSLVPNRESLEFDSDLFKGTYEHIFFTTETKSENHVHRKVEQTMQDQIVKREKLVEVEDGGHYEEREIGRDIFEQIVAAFTSIRFGNDDWKKTRTVKHWVPDFKKILVDDSYVAKMIISYIKTTTTWKHYERDVYEVWKILTGGIRIFKATEYSDWHFVREKIINDQIEFMPKQSESSEATLDE